MKPIISDANRSRLDKIAVVLSSICLVHCLALPFLLTLLPITQGAFIDEALFHFLMLTVILPVSLLALGIGCRKHKDVLTIVLGVLGLGILTLTALFGHDWFGLTGERLVTSLGGLILAGAHIQNFRVCRTNNCPHDH